MTERGELVLNFNRTRPEMLMLLLLDFALYAWYKHGRSIDIISFLDEHRKAIFLKGDIDFVINWAPG